MEGCIRVIVSPVSVGVHLLSLVLFMILLNVLLLSLLLLVLLLLCIVSFVMLYELLKKEGNGVIYLEMNENIDLEKEREREKEEKNSFGGFIQTI